LYRGKQKVGSEWNLVCAAFNVKKLAAMLGSKGYPANPERPTFFLLSGLLARLTRSVRLRAFTVAPLAEAA
jgi:hypothetical protein